MTQQTKDMFSKSFTKEGSRAQHAEWDLNKIEKTFNGTFAG